MFFFARLNSKACPNVHVYCWTHALAGWLIEQLLITLKKDANVNKEKHPENLLLGMYHSSSFNANKTRVMYSLRDNISTSIRVVIAISALGCGIICKNVKFVFHFGPDFSLVEYCQQIGRAGRDGEDGCHAVLSLSIRVN